MAAAHHGGRPRSNRARWLDRTGRRRRHEHDRARREDRSERRSAPGRDRQGGSPPDNAHRADGRRALMSGLTQEVKRAFIFPGDGNDLNPVNPPWSFDCVLRESHTSDLVITDNPLETGVVASDHAYMAPDRLEIEAAVGDVWLYALSNVSDLQRSLKGTNPIPRVYAPDTFSSDGARSGTCWRMLKNLQASAVPFTIQTGLDLYTDMVIEHLGSEQEDE